MARARSARARADDDSSTRSLLIETVAAIMSDEQSVDFSLSEVGERSGLNTALVHYYFGGKHGMMMALLKQVIEAETVRLEELVQTDLAPDEKMRLHICAIVNAYHSHPYLNRLLHRLGRVEHGKFGEQIGRELVGPLFRAEKTILDEGVKIGIFRRIDPMFFYFHVAGACDSIFHSKYVLHHAFGVETISKKLRDDFGQSVSDIVLRGILAHKD